MAPGTTHLVIGERVFPQIESIFGPLDYGSFLLGCLLVDVHGYSDIDRRTTHFADRLDPNSPYAFHKSCQNFVNRLGNLLIHPWGQLSNSERAFVLGYLCHLAADENWKQYDWDILNRQGIYLWADLPVPGDIILTVFDVLSNRLYTDYPAVSNALRNTTIPNIFSHVSHQSFQRMWEIVRIHVEEGTLESFLEVQRRLGKGRNDLQAIYEQYQVNWSKAESMIFEYFGGIPQRVQAMVWQVSGIFTRYGDRFAAQPPAEG